jgi:hypothetical protein
MRNAVLSLRRCSSMFLKAEDDQQREVHPGLVCSFFLPTCTVTAKYAENLGVQYQLSGDERFVAEIMGSNVTTSDSDQ